VGGIGVSVGWLSCTWVGHFVTLEDFQHWALPYLGEFVFVPRRWRGYEIVWQGENGVMLGIRPRESGELELHLDVPAAVLESLDGPSLFALLWKAQCHAQNVTRLDVTVDDWSKVITPMQLEVMTSGADNPYDLNRDQLVTKAKSTDFRRSKGPRGGDTWYLGGTTGDARLRVYDKARESLGEVDAIRWELQTRSERAKQALTALTLEACALAAEDGPATPERLGLALTEVMGTWASKQLVRFVDFRDRSQDPNVSRCPRLSWWAAIVADTEKAVPVVVDPPLTVERMHDYAAVALPSWLATLADSAPVVAGVSPEAYILAMLRDGRQKRSARHGLALRSAGVVA
jgi:hypothetical protein